MRLPLLLLLLSLLTTAMSSACVPSPNTFDTLPHSIRLTLRTRAEQEQRFGKAIGERVHWTLAQLAREYDDARQCAIEFLQRSQIRFERVERLPSAVKVHAANVADLQRVFDSDVHVLTCEFAEQAVVRLVDSAGAAAKLPDCIAHVHDLFDAPIKARRMKSSAHGPSAGQMSPFEYRRQLGVTWNATKPSKFGLGLAEFEQAYFFPRDVATFQNMFGIPDNPVTIVGPNKPNSGYLGEATLDMEVATACAVNVDTYAFSVAAAGFDLLAWSDMILNASFAHVRTHSISWGSGESTFSAAHLSAVNQMFQHLALLGFTVVAASGDAASGHTGWWCGKFDATFPATSPWVLAVGGVQSNQHLWSMSGAGFSNTFAQLGAQKAAVQKFRRGPFGAQMPSAQLYNVSGRTVPDLVAFADNIFVITSNASGVLSGTSAATPQVAAMLALVSEKRGKPLGFVTDQLYTARFVDIWQGQQEAVEECPAGFKAQKQFDIASGNGMPKLAMLEQQLH